MKLEQQVCSLELAQKLKELGVKQESLFVWARPTHMPNLKWLYWYSENLKIPRGQEEIWESLQSFTVAELGELLPARLEYKRPKHPVYRLAMEKQDTRWNVVYICADCGGRNFEPMLANTEADARATMLIYLLENKLSTV